MRDNVAPVLTLNAYRATACDKRYATSQMESSEGGWEDGKGRMKVMIVRTQV